ncbi:asparagine synthase (glutamine-hydrolyzing) [bacterium]|nr:asparagine synthase (glutamine-hydrolyzing) [bacterium]
MCGINGFVGVNKEALEQMNHATVHRGPDYSGIFVDGEVSLGHNLLSIREAAELSKQPFTKPHSTWVLLFNGQLYNTRELRAHLDSSYQNTDLDTALLFGMIEKYGWNFVEKIHGMFSILLYNKEEKIIKLYRDASGQKVLYYYSDGRKFIFSSEIKAILAHEEIDRAVDEEAVLIAAHIGYIPGEKTLWKNIKKLNLSQCVSFNLKSKTLASNYFQSKTENYYGEKSPEEVFEDLVREHLQSKQKVALNLSGGLDSSLLLHEMSKVGHEMHTYSTYFEGGHEKYNRDASFAKQLAKDYGATHREIDITKNNFLANFIEAYERIEEPNFNITLPAYLITAKVEGANGDKNRVILSGDGGDEVFGGYPHYELARKMERQMLLLTPVLFNILKNKRNNADYDFRNPAERWLFFRDLRPKYLTKDFREEIKKYTKESTANFLENYSVKKDGATSMVYETMLTDRALWMTGENFIRSDKLYMSQSLELRSPLSYHPLRVYFDKLLKRGDYINESGNKIFLRKLYTGKLPDYITKRPDKTGWRSPVADWYDKDFKNTFLEILAPMNIKSGEGSMIDWVGVRKHVEKTDAWPGKSIHLYLSLAILAKKYNIKI